MKKLPLCVLMTCFAVCGVAVAHHHHEGDHRGVPPMMRDHAPIPPSGHGKGVTRLLFKFDENHDGALSREELEKYRKEGLKYTKQMSENTVPFEKADLNHDGFLTFDEYLQLPREDKFKILGFAGPGSAHGHHEGHHNEKKDIKPEHANKYQKNEKVHHNSKKLMHDFRRFSFFDNDFDGKISFNEYANLISMRTENINAMQDTLIRMDFSAMDLNKDEVISPIEIHHYIGSILLSKAPKYKKIDEQSMEFGDETEDAVDFVVEDPVEEDS